jgi:hypothetical protein
VPTLTCGFVRSNFSFAISILQRTMPVLWFYVCIQLLVHTARGQRGTGSQTGLSFFYPAKED